MQKPGRPHLLEHDSRLTRLEVARLVQLGYRQREKEAVDSAAGGVPRAESSLHVPVRQLTEDE